MTTARLLAAAAMAVAFSAAPAFAAPVAVTITAGGWLAGDGWGAACGGPDCDPTHSALNLNWTVDAGLAGTSFELGAVGASRTVRFGSGILAEEDGHLFATEIDDLGLSLWLTLATPFAGTIGQAAELVAAVGPLKDQGSNVDIDIRFDPVLLSLADGAELQLELSPLTWNCQGIGTCTYDPGKPPGTQQLSATFTLLAEAAPEPAGLTATAIPEPSSLMLLGIGLAGMGLRRWVPRD